MKRKNKLVIFRSDIKNNLKRAVTILKSHGATTIVLFGSQIKGEAKDYSDIDIACEGIPPEMFYHVVGKLLCAIRTPFDLVDINDTEGLFRENIKKGIILYERK